jgi:hypothetical protein
VVGGCTDKYGGRAGVADKPEHLMSEARQVASIIWQEKLNSDVLHKELD